MTLLAGLDHARHAARCRAALREARVGVLTHAAAIDRRGRHTLTVLDELGANVASSSRPSTGSTPTRKPKRRSTASEVAEAALPRREPVRQDARGRSCRRASSSRAIDLLVIDLADVGTRYYTYVWTALLAARAARDAGIHTVVLDRPNPISGDPATLEGAPQREGFLSFVGLEPLPIRHALTLGEILAHFFERDGQPLGPDGALSVVSVAGWERHRTAQAWGRPFVMPCPNMPTLETALVYPGGCLVEGTNLSEGRGTTAPFQLVGAPFLDGRALADRARAKPGFPARSCDPVTFRPTFEKHAGQRCSGVMLHVTNPSCSARSRPTCALIALARAQAPDAFEFRTTPYEFETTLPAFDLLTGLERRARSDRRRRIPTTSPSSSRRSTAPGRDVVREAEARLERAQRLAAGNEQR